MTAEDASNVVSCGILPNEGEEHEMGGTCNTNGGEEECV
jgi:hypothetical protein